MTSPLDQLRDALRQFAAARDWEKFHSPKNLAISLSVEASELLEQFQWEAESAPISADKKRRVEEELADVLLYLIRLADKVDVDLVQAAQQKLELNARRYPVEKSRGVSTKHTEL